MERGRKSVAIIGAGPAGLTAAYLLAKEGIQVEVFEASSRIGGLCRSFELFGQTVDLGPHRFFSNDPRVNSLWLEIAGRDYRMVDRLTRIYYRKRFFHYPLKPLNALKNLGVFEALRCVLSYGRQRLTVKDGGEDTFELWVISRFGRRLFEIFFKTYSEKLWGVRCSDLDSDFAAQRIKKLSLFEAVKSAFLGNFRNKHKTLVDRFAYPLGGTGAIYQRMAQKIEALGGKVHLQTPIAGVVNEGALATGIHLQNGQTLAFDHVISTMPLTLLLFSLKGIDAQATEAARQLRYRNTIMIYLEVKAKDLFPDNWLYVHSSDLLMGRITNFRNWIPELCGNSESTILALEYWCFSEDDFWKTDDQTLIDLAKKEVRKTGLAGQAEISNAHVERINRCYPVYDRGYKQKLDLVVAELDKIKNLTPIGRYGAFKYNNQDHSILMGIFAAENILGKGRHNLWSVNTDYESYQEEATITETGLEIKVKAPAAAIMQNQVSEQSLESAP